MISSPLIRRFIIGGKNQYHRKSVRALIQVLFFYSLLFLLVAASALFAQVSNSEPDPDFPIVNRMVHALYAAEDHNLLFIGGEFDFIGPSSGSGVIFNKQTLAWVRDAPKFDRGMYLATPDGFGGFLIAGNFRRVGNFDRRNLARLNPDLRVNTSFDPSPGSSIEFIRLHGDRMFAVAHDWVAPVNSGGIGTRIYPNVTQYTVFEDQLAEIIMAGVYQHPEFGARHGIFKIDKLTSGVEDHEWFIQLDKYHLTQYDVRMLVAYGNFLYIATSNGVKRADLMTGEIDPDWGLGANGSIENIIISGGVIYVCGSFSQIGDKPYKNVAAIEIQTGQVYDWDCEIEGGYADCISVTDNGNRLLIFSDDIIKVRGEEVSGLAFIRTPGVALPGSRFVIDFDTGINYRDEGMYESEFTFAESGNYYFIGGGFNIANGVPRSGLAVMDTETGVILDMPPGIWDGRVNSFVRDGDMLFIGGDFALWEEGYTSGMSSIIAYDLANRSLADWTHEIYGYVNIRSMVLTDDHIFAGGNFYYVEREQDYFDRYNIFSLNRNNGTLTGWAPEIDGAVNAMVSHENTLYIGGNFWSINGQERKRLAAFDIPTGTLLDWNPDADAGVYALLIHDNNLIAGGDFSAIGDDPRSRIAAFSLEDGSITGWTAETGRIIRSLHASGNILYAGAEQESNSVNDNRLRAYYTDRNTDNRIDWDIAINHGVETIQYLEETGKLIIGGNFTRINDDYWRNNLAMIDGPQTGTVSIRETPSEEVPAAVRLHQNYPNPFNPATEIGFSLPEYSHVVLEVFDITGRRISVLVDQFVPAGSHTVRFDASGLAGGVYLYRLQTSDNSLLRKMVLVK